MKILLISANTEFINMPVLPLGMAYVAAAVEHAGHYVKTVNLMAQSDFRTILKSAFKGFDPEVIGVSVRNIDDQSMEKPRFLLEPVKAVISECRRLSDALIVLGGAGYSIFPKEVLAWLEADMGIQGEGEAAFVELLERIEKKADISGIAGLWLPKTGLQAKVKLSSHLDKFPMPVPGVHLTFPENLKKEDIWIPFQTRRGCPMRCSYCSTPLIEGRIMRRHSPERVVEGLCRFVEAGFNRFFFVDNTFNFPPSYTEALCDRIYESGINIKWRCILYPYNITENLVEKMKKAGCSEVSLGFESGCEKILKRMRKRFTPKDIKRVSEILGEHSIGRMGFQLFGGPGETKSTIEKSLKFTDDLGLESVKITTGIRIYPRTLIYETAIKEGLIDSNESIMFPKFYMTQGLEDLLKITVAEWIATRKNWRI